MMVFSRKVSDFSLQGVNSEIQINCEFPVDIQRSVSGISPHHKISPKTRPFISIQT